MNRSYLIKTHLLLASFIFPVALMFAVTGGLYTWGIKGSYSSENHIIELSQSMNEDIVELRALATKELHRLEIETPSGNARITKNATPFQFEWIGSKCDVLLEPSINQLQANLTIKKNNWHRQLVQLHKAKGGILFKIYAATLAVSLFLIFASGFIMAWQIPNYRPLAIVFFITGSIVFVTVVMFS